MYTKATQEQCSWKV